MATDLLKKMASVSASSIKNVETLENSRTFNIKDTIRTGVPIINAAFSGDIMGGFTTGLTVLAGESKTFKTMMSLYCLKAYQDQYPESVCLFYDCEYGVTPQYLKSFGIDSSRILHIPVKHVEELKFDMVKRLEEISMGDKVFVLIDSIGAMASKKEVEDAVDQKSVADMSRAKAIRSLLRVITPYLTQKNLPCFMINHVMKEIGSMYPKTVIPGGTAVEYNSNSIFVITKAQEKTGTDVTGYKFTINIHKSRFVKEKSQFPFKVDMTSGINQWSGLLDMALESGHVVKPNMGWYAKVDTETGEMIEGKYRAKDTENYEFWTSILKSKSFRQWVKNRYQYGAEVQFDKMLNLEWAENLDEMGERNDV